MILPFKFRVLKINTYIDHSTDFCSFSTSLVQIIYSISIWCLIINGINAICHTIDYWDVISYSSLKPFPLLWRVPSRDDYCVSLMMLTNQCESVKSDRRCQAGTATANSLQVHHTMPGLVSPPTHNMMENILWYEDESECLL